MSADHTPSRLTPWRPYLLLACALPFLFILWGGRPAVEPFSQVYALTFVVLGLRLLLATQPASDQSPAGALPKGLGWIDLILALGLGVAATHRLLAPGFPRGHDIVTHLWGTYGFFQAIQAGNPYPRWIHHLGLGMPFLLFYPPLGFYFMLPFMWLGSATYDAFKYGLILFNALSGLSMFFVVSRWTRDRRAALLAAAAYCFAPYHTLESNYRVAIAEAAAMAVIPLFFYYGAQAVASPSRRSFRPAVVWTAILTITHPLSLSMSGTGLFLWLLTTFKARFTRPFGKAVLLLALLGALGTGLAGFYTLPVAAEGRYVTISSSLNQAKKPMYYWHGLYPWQLVARQGWSSWQRSESRGSEDNRREMPFYFGITLLALIPLARSKDTSQSTTVLGLKGLTLGSLALTLFPLDAILAWLPPMTMLQFPWRFLSIATFGGAALVGFAFTRVQDDARALLPARPAAHYLELAAPVLILAMLLQDFAPFGGAPMWAKPYKGIYELTARRKVPDPLPLRVDRLEFPPADPAIDLSLLRRVYPEYFTPATRKAFQRGGDDEGMLERAAVGITFAKGGGGPRTLNPAPYAELFPANGGPSLAVPFSRAGEHIQVTLPAVAGRLEVKEQFFPGWDALLDGSPIQVDATQDGLMQVTLEDAVAGKLDITFSRTRWDRLGGILLSLAVLGGLWIPWRKKDL